MLQNVIFADKNRTSSIFFGNLESGGWWKPHQEKEYETICIGKVTQTKMGKREAFILKASKVEPRKFIRPYVY